LSYYLLNEMFSNYLDIYDDLISRRVNTSDAEKFAEICPCPCNGFAWGVIWSAPNFNSYFFLYLWCCIKIILMVTTPMLTFAVLSFRGFISFIFLCASIYLGLVILSWGDSYVFILPHFILLVLTCSFTIALQHRAQSHRCY